MATFVIIIEMARLTNNDVLKLAKLAKLDLTSEEADSLAQEITDILGHVEQLQEVDVDGLKPTYQVSGLKNVTRSDTVKIYEATSEDLLKNVPAKESDQIKVKRVL